VQALYLGLYQPTRTYSYKVGFTKTVQLEGRIETANLVKVIYHDGKLNECGFVISVNM
jgi:hypothetical protein